MEKMRHLRAKRSQTVSLYFLISIVQIILIGYIQLDLKETGIGYDLAFSSTYRLDSGLIWLLLLAPIIVSYYITVSRFSSLPNTVQLIGPKSLLARIELEISESKIGGYEYDEDVLKSFIYKLAEGEPEGTVDNLEMMIRVALISRQLLDQTKAKSVKRVYISDDPLPNAYTIRALPIPFLGADWIVINRSLIDLLNENEFRAVLAHEIGHVKNYDSWISIFYHSPRLVNLIITATLLSTMSSPLFEKNFGIDLLLNAGIVVLTIIGYQIVMRTMNIISQYSQRLAELRADVYSTETMSYLHLANALYRIYQKGLILQAVLNTSNEIQGFYPTLKNENLHMNLLLIIPPNERSFTNALLLLERQIGRIKAELQEGEEFVPQERVREKLKTYPIIGPMFSDDLVQRIESERSISLNKSELENILHQISAENANEQIQETLSTLDQNKLYPSIFERFELIYELGKNRN